MLKFGDLDPDRHQNGMSDLDHHQNILIHNKVFNELIILFYELKIFPEACKPFTEVYKKNCNARFEILFEFFQCFCHRNLDLNSEMRH